MFKQQKKQQKKQLDDKGELNDKWELPRHEWYRVRQKKASHGKPIRDGTVICQSQSQICVYFDDGWNEKGYIEEFVRIPAEAVVGATAEAAVGAAAPAAQERDYRNINALNLDRGNPGWWQ